MLKLVIASETPERRGHFPGISLAARRDPGRRPNLLILAYWNPSVLKTLLGKSAKIENVENEYHQQFVMLL